MPDRKNWWRSEELDYGSSPYTAVPTSRNWILNEVKLDWSQHYQVKTWVDLIWSLGFHAMKVRRDSHLLHCPSTKVCRHLLNSYNYRKILKQRRHRQLQKIFCQHWISLKLWNSEIWHLLEILKFWNWTFVGLKTQHLTFNM